MIILNMLLLCTCIMSSFIHRQRTIYQQVTTVFLMIFGGRGLDISPNWNEHELWLKFKELSSYNCYVTGFTSHNFMQP